MTSDRRILLPKEVVPINYQINLTPNLDDFTFLGEVTIDVAIKSPTRNVVLNCAELEIISSSITMASRPSGASPMVHDPLARSVLSIFNR